MASTADIAKRYLGARGDQDLDDAVACWKPGEIDRLVGAQELVAPDGIRAYFGKPVLRLPGLRARGPGLHRRSDRLALASDCFYTLNVQTGRKLGPRIPQVAFGVDAEQARASIRKLAALGPGVAGAGHADPVTGDVRGRLGRAAEAPV